MSNYVFGRVLKIRDKIIKIIVKIIFCIKKYKKKIHYYKIYSAYDIFNESSIGDYVILRKSRPIKKTVFWILAKIIEKIKLI